MSTYKKIPKAKGFDNTIRLKNEGYPFIPTIMSDLHTDIFQTRLMGKKIICITGKEAAKLFYDPEYFIRHKANPKRIQKTLFGVNAIQGMDGDAHLHRKQLFLSILSEERLTLLREIVRTKYMNAIPKWKEKEQVCLFTETASILCESTCEWCDVPITPQDARIRSEQFMTMVYAIAQIGPKYWKGKSARKSTEEWIESVIKEVRSGRRKPKKESALYQISNYHDLTDVPLTDRAAAIELINVIRPIVAISIYIVYAALALHEHPQYIDLLKVPNDPYYNLFVQEVRRYYPLGPFLGARVKKDFKWHDYLFKEGTLVFLDAYGINSDPSIWKSPKVFSPENFRDWDEDEFELIPQGGGDPATGHRCPGEGITLELMKDTIDFLVNKIEYTVPPQNLSYSLKKIPTLPESGFLMTNINKRL
ncbi:cytochrome P450 152A1 [Lachnospiraceae bacterium KM106-2]|nr:cytochrome P450 152A1 [Lachnospiraceae bacterium KM106-2]